MKMKIGRVMVPFLYYIAVMFVVEILVFGSGLFGEDIILWNTLFLTIAAMPGLWYFYWKDRSERGEIRWNLKAAVLLGLTGAFTSGLSRGVIEALGMLDYENAEKLLLSGEVWLQILVLVGASPVLEEFLFRGVLYGRLRDMASPKLAMIFSALLFGLYHGNLSQGIYGFFMGLFLAWTLEYCQTIKAPIVVHVAANAVALVLAL